MRAVLVKVYLLFWSSLELGIRISGLLELICQSSLSELFLELRIVAHLETTKIYR